VALAKGPNDEEEEPQCFKELISNACCIWTWMHVSTHFTTDKLYASYPAIQNRTYLVRCYIHFWIPN